MTRTLTGHPDRQSLNWIAKLNQLAQAVEYLPGTNAPDAHRLMNLPSWAGHVNAAVIRINQLPADYSPAQFGYLVGSTGGARTLAALMDDGDADEAELKRRLTGDGLNYDAHLDNLRNVGLIQCEGNILRAHPGLTTNLATLIVYQYTTTPRMGAPLLAFAAQAWTVHRPSTKGPDRPMARWPGRATTSYRTTPQELLK